MKELGRIVVHENADAWRRDMLGHLAASLHHLETVDRRGAARELVVQGLDLLEPAYRAALVREAIGELDAEKGRHRVGA